jgi:hypothetical protein
MLQLEKWCQQISLLSLSSSGLVFIQLPEGWGMVMGERGLAEEDEKERAA